MDRRRSSVYDPARDIFKEISVKVDLPVDANSPTALNATDATAATVVARPEEQVARAEDRTRTTPPGLPLIDTSVARRVERNDPRESPPQRNVDSAPSVRCPEMVAASTGASATQLSPKLSQCASPTLLTSPHSIRADRPDLAVFSLHSQPPLPLSHFPPVRPDLEAASALPTLVPASASVSRVNYSHGPPVNTAPQQRSQHQQSSFAAHAPGSYQLCSVDYANSAQIPHLHNSPENPIVRHRLGSLEGFVKSSRVPSKIPSNPSARVSSRSPQSPQDLSQNLPFSPQLSGQSPSLRPSPEVTEYSSKQLSPKESDITMGEAHPSIEDKGSAFRSPGSCSIKELDQLSPRLNQGVHNSSQPRKKRPHSPDAELDHASPLGSPVFMDNSPSISRKGALEEVPPKRLKQSPTADEYKSPVPMTTSNLPRFARKSRERSQSHTVQDRPHSPHHTPNPYSERRLQSTSQPRDPSPIRRSPSPPQSPPRKRKRPGASSRLSAVDREAIRRRQAEREAQQLREARRVAEERGLQDVVTQHYNAVPERGREWRKTDSRIKGLRSFNNWVKSCIIQKYSPDDNFNPAAPNDTPPLCILDIGCGKGGDLGKWHQSPQPVNVYIGLDPADVSIHQARERYNQMRHRGGYRGNKLFHGEFYVKDCFGSWIGDIPIIHQIGVEQAVGPGASGMQARWGGGGFDVVSMMFCMHYAFESEVKARGMLRNVAGALKKGGRFIGVIPNSDVLVSHIISFHKKLEEKRLLAQARASQSKEEEAPEEGELEENETLDDHPQWGNSIYRVRFHGPTPPSGEFRPPFGWKYSYFMEEAVEGIPEYVVPWEAFRAMADDYNLSLAYKMPFLDVWKEFKDDCVLGPLSERMGVRGRGRGGMLVSDEELEAAGFYLAFCFTKV